MASILNIIFYVLIFLSVYVQVFFFVTFLENRKKIIIRKGKTNLNHYRKVTIAVPCFNEEKTIEKTIRSLLSLNYPQDKIKIILVDDGSTDNTWSIINKYAKYPNIKVFHKENGGKHTALNLALKHTDTDFFGGLDADSFADSEALVRMMSFLEKDPDAMAVVPSVIVYDFKNTIQSAQKAEYHMGVYLKKMLGFLGAINVTPGPLTIFRRRVFQDLGPYRQGHNTEDMEIAFRMQKHKYKIEHCNDAYVYTSTPMTVRKLYQQRLRWIYGFINNTFDYKGIILRKEYGNFSTFTLPMGLISIFAVCYIFLSAIYNFSVFIYSKFIIFKTVGFNFASPNFNFDFFFLNLRFSVFLVVLVYFLIIFAMVFGRRMVEGKWGLSFNMLYFLPIFSIIAPFWLMSAVLNTVFRRIPAWR